MLTITNVQNMAQVKQIFTGEADLANEVYKLRDQLSRALKAKEIIPSELTRAEDQLSKERELQADKQRLYTATEVRDIVNKFDYWQEYFRRTGWSSERSVAEWLDKYVPK